MISSTRKAFLIIALASIASMIVGTSLLQAARIQAQTPQQMQFARSIQTFQNTTHIIITIAKAPKADEQGPIIVIPPNTTQSKGNETEKGNATLPSDSQQVNETQPSGGNITAIEPSQNITVVPLPPASNVTQIDNGTIIIAPPDRNITQTPGNVTVIDPPQCTCKLHHGHHHGMVGKVPPSGNQSVGIVPPAAGNTTKTNETGTGGITPKPPMTAGNTTNSNTSNSGLSLSAATMKALHHR